MKRLSLACGVAFCLLLVASLNPVLAKDKWTSIRSKNFVLVGNANEKEMRQIATRLEQFRDVFTRLLKQTNFSSSTPTTVIVFKSHSAYQKFAPPNTAGYFQPGNDMNYIALSPIQDEANDPFRTIFHEFVHLLVKNNVQNMPLWFNEGLAEYYSTFEIRGDDRKVRLGKVISGHVFELRQRKFIPLKTLFSVDHSSPLYNESNKQSMFYAESWALVHYLLLNEQRQPQLGRFLNLILAGKSPDEAFPEAFQTDFATIEKELKDYIRRDTYPQQIATFERKLEFDLEMQSVPLTEAQGEFYLGDLSRHTGQFEEAEKHLQNAIKLDANLAMAHASLGMLEINRNRPAEATRYLERAVAANTGNYLVHYYYAYVLSREVITEGRPIYKIEPELAAKMRAELKKAIEINPGFADSYHLLAFVNLVSGEQLDESIALLKRAIELLPGAQEFGYLLAQIYLRKNDFKLARETLEPIVRSSATETQLRQHAQSLLTSLQEMEEQMSRDKSGGGSTAPPPGSNVLVIEPDAEGKTRTPEEMLLEVLDQVLKKPQEGEQRVQGQLQKIECGSKNVVFFVQVAGRLLKLSAVDFQGVQYTSYVQQKTGLIGCGQRTPVDEVVVIYRPVKGKFDGEIVSVDFVPKDFKLKQ
ncbi:MAG: tetratricopeptide repeat protein [Pyrinomonadaceae bacterium]|nr:tetratricopeptide repeat protein [Pyrinomonadaceae bacterium]